MSKGDAGKVGSGGPPFARGEFSVVLPMPPSVNNQYATVNGRRVLSAEARRFKSLVRDKIGAMGFEGTLSPEMLETLRRSYLSLFIDFYFPTPLKRDLDGGLKITQDALCEALGVNDNRVVDIHLVKKIDPLNPRIQVQIETIPEEDWEFDEEYFYTGAPGGATGPKPGTDASSSPSPTPTSTQGAQG